MQKYCANIKDNRISIFLKFCNQTQLYKVLAEEVHIKINDPFTPVKKVKNVTK